MHNYTLITYPNHTNIKTVTVCKYGWMDARQRAARRQISTGKPFEAKLVVKTRRLLVPIGR